MKKISLPLLLVGLFMLGSVGKATDSDPGFSCKVVYILDFLGGAPGSLQTQEKHAFLQINHFSKRWFYRLTDKNFEIIATRKQGEKGINAWISEAASGHAVLSNVVLTEWKGPLFLSLRTKTGLLINGRKVTQLNLECKQL